MLTPDDQLLLAIFSLLVGCAGLATWVAGWVGRRMEEEGLDLRKRDGRWKE